MLARAKHYTDQGLTAIKMQAGHIRPWRADVANVKAMREFVGDDVEIMVDVNMGWTADIAIQAGRHFDDYDIYWLEEPVVCEDFEGYQRIASHLKTRVVGGESHYTRFDMRPFFKSASCPILQPDPQRGGFTELRKIAAVADTYGLQIAPHVFHELTVHCRRRSRTRAISNTWTGTTTCSSIRASRSTATSRRPRSRGMGWRSAPKS